MFVVYKITRKDNLEYIGITKNMGARVSQHIKSPRFSLGIEKVEVLETAESYEEAEELEEFFIQKFDTWKNGLNLTQTGKGLNEGTKFNTLGYKFSERSRQKMKDNHWSKTGSYTPRGRAASEKQRAHLTKIAKERQVRTKLSKQDVVAILTNFKNRPHLEGVGHVAANGRKLTYERLFAKSCCGDYDITSAQLMNIITGKAKAWKCIFQEIMKN